MTYKIVRSYFDSYSSETIETGLTLDEAQAHCRDPESSSSTCTTAESQAVTKIHGPWFDGFEES